jgi:hypothetical protein
MDESTKILPVFRHSIASLPDPDDGWVASRFAELGAKGGFWLHYGNVVTVISTLDTWRAWVQKTRENRPGKAPPCNNWNCPAHPRFDRDEYRKRLEGP